MSALVKSKYDEFINPRLFDPEALGLTFEELAIDVVQGENTEFISRWYRAREADADLVIWSDGSRRIVKQQICIFGQVVEWNPINGTRTGVVVEQESGAPDERYENETSSAEKSRQKATRHAASAHSGRMAHVVYERDVIETIQFDNKPQTSSVNLAVRMLAVMPFLSESERKSLVFHLRESPKLHKKARERALQTWAPAATEIISNNRPSVWGRMRNWFLGN